MSSFFRPCLPHADYGPAVITVGNKTDLARAVPGGRPGGRTLWGRGYEDPRGKEAGERGGPDRTWGEEAEHGHQEGPKPREGRREAAPRGGGTRSIDARSRIPGLTPGSGREESRPTDLPSGSLAANAASAPWLRRNCKAVSPAPAAPTTAPATKPLRKRREPLKRDAKLLAAILPRYLPFATARAHSGFDA